MGWRKSAGFAAALAAALGVVWAAGWLWGAEAKRAALAEWLQKRRAEGWQAEAAAIAVTGFPWRFETRVDAPALADPAQGWAWRAPRLDIVAPLLAPGRATLRLPSEQTLAIPGARAVLRSDALRADLALKPERALRLETLTAGAESLALIGEGWSLETGPAGLRISASDPATAPDDAYALAFSAEAAQIAGLAAPVALDALRLTARAAFDRPLDRRAVEGAPPQLRALSLGALEARWGAMALDASGSVRADARGYAEGRLDLRARGWRAMLRAAVEAGAIDRGLARALEAGLSLAAALSGGGNALEVPLRLEGGSAYVGPLRVGRAPRLARP